MQASDVKSWRRESAPPTSENLRCLCERCSGHLEERAGAAVVTAARLASHGPDRIPALDHALLRRSPSRDRVDPTLKLLTILGDVADESGGLAGRWRAARDAEGAPNPHRAGEGGRLVATLFELRRFGKDYLPWLGLP